MYQKTVKTPALLTSTRIFLKFLESRGNLLSLGSSLVAVVIIIIIMTIIYCIRSKFVFLLSKGIHK